MRHPAQRYCVKDSWWGDLHGGVKDPWWVAHTLKDILDGGKFLTTRGWVLSIIEKLM